MIYHQKCMQLHQYCVHGKFLSIFLRSRLIIQVPGSFKSKTEYSSSTVGDLNNV
jgi:hypothetical protein